MADLVTLAQVQTALPNLLPAQVADAPSVITAVSRACDHECKWPLALTDFDRVYRPGRTRKVYLHARPVAALTRLKTDLVVALALTNADATTNQVATVRQTPTAPPPNSGPPATIVLTRTASGTTTTNTLTLSGYATLAALAAAVNALGGGWSATLGAALGPGTGVALALLSPAELNYDGGATGALLQTAELRWYYRDIDRYVLDDLNGVIELTENRPEAFRYADRAFSNGYGWSWSGASEPRHAGVRAVYRAGYAVQPADLALGYAPVPDDLQRAVIIAVQATIEATAAPDRQGETSGSFSYSKTADGPALLPRATLRVLNNGYRNPRTM